MNVDYSHRASVPQSIASTHAVDSLTTQANQLISGFPERIKKLSRFQTMLLGIVAVCVMLVVLLLTLQESPHYKEHSSHPYRIPDKKTFQRFDANQLNDIKDSHEFVAPVVTVAPTFTTTDIPRPAPAYNPLDSAERNQEIDTSVSNNNHDGAQLISEPSNYNSVAEDHAITPQLIVDDNSSSSISQTDSSSEENSDIKRVETMKSFVLNRSRSNPFPLLTKYYEYSLQLEMTKRRSAAKHVKAKDIGILDRLHRMLRTGSLCSELPHTSLQYKATPISSSSTSTVTSNSVHHEVASTSATNMVLLKSLEIMLQSSFSKVLIEYTDQPIHRTYSYHFAHQRSNLTTLVLNVGHKNSLSDSSDAFSSSGCHAVPSGRNLYSTEQHPGQMFSKFTGALDCLQIIDDFSFFVNQLLPYEFESQLGKLICRCRYSYIAASMPDDPFFSAWDSMRSLITSAVQSMGKEQCGFSINEASTLPRSHLIVEANTSSVEEKIAASRSIRSQSQYSLRGRSIFHEKSVNAEQQEHVEFGGPKKESFLGYLKVQALLRLPLDQSTRSNLLAAFLHFVAINSTRDMNGSEISSSILEDLYILASDIFYSTKNGDYISILKQWHHSADEYSKSHNRQDISSLEKSHGNTLTTFNYSTSHAQRRLTGGAPPLMGSNHSITKSDVEATQVGTTSSNGRTTTSTSTNGLKTTRSTSSRSRTRVSRMSTGPTDTGDQIPETFLSVQWLLPADSQDFDSSSDIDQKLQTYSIHPEEVGMSLNSKEPVVPSGSNSKGKEKLGLASRLRVRYVQNRESAVVSKWMNAIQASYGCDNEINCHSQSTSNDIKNARMIYIVGDLITTLSLKLSKFMSKHRGGGSNSGMIISVLSDSNSIRSHQVLASIMGITNNIVCYKQWDDLNSLTNLIVSPEKADMMILQSDVVMRIFQSVLLESSKFTADKTSNNYEKESQEDDIFSSTDLKHVTVTDPMICDVTVIEEALALMLSLAKITLIEIPSRTFFMRFNGFKFFSASACGGFEKLLFGNGTDGEVIDLLERAIRRLPFDINARIYQLSAAGETLIYRVELLPNGDASVPSFYSSSSSTKMELGKGYSSFVSRSSDYGLSVHTALQLGLIDDQRRDVLKLLIELPTWKLKTSLATALSPHHLFIRVLCRSDVKGEPSRSRTSSEISLCFLSITLQDGTIFNSRNRASKYSEGHLSRNDLLINAQKEGKGDLGASLIPSLSATQDRLLGRAVWNTLTNEFQSHSAELSNGEFSFSEYSSGFGYLSLRLAAEYPNATVLSHEHDITKVKHHVAVASALGLHNNAICWQGEESDYSVVTKLYESPEMLRFQLFVRGALDRFVQASTTTEWGQLIGTMLSTALTSFIVVPNPAQVSWAMQLITGEQFEPASTMNSEYEYLEYYFPHAPITSHELKSFVEFHIHGLQDSEESYTASASNLLGQHPHDIYSNFEQTWLLEKARVSGGDTEVVLKPIGIYSDDGSTSSPFVGIDAVPLVRCDIVNMTRHVHHHYDYSKDGHKRTYTMLVHADQALTEAVATFGDPSKMLSYATEHGVMLKSTASPFIKNELQSGGVADTIRSSGEEGNSQQLIRQPNTLLQDDGSLLLPLGYHPNQHSITGVHLYRDHDTFPIPYTSIRGVTLISILRMGLYEAQRDQLFKEFLDLPLFEDMAPWNVVLMGSHLDYIDYDTRDVTYDQLVPAAYKVMTVLMNYKRTVEDFKRCGKKSGTVYGFPFVSECVGNTNLDKTLKCDDLSYPVPCPDGVCHTDYISCLKSLSVEAEQFSSMPLSSATTEEHKMIDVGSTDAANHHLVAAMRSILGKFDDKHSTASAARNFSDIFHY